MELNGIAHIILTAGNFKASTDFWRALIGRLGLKIVLDTDQMLYGVGGRTAIGIRPAAPEHEGKRFDQGHPGLHHVCFRMRDRKAIEELHDWLQDQPVTIVHGPEEGPWAPGYFSILFEDPDGTRIEFNHVPGTGLLTEGAQIGGVRESAWQ